MHRIAAVVTRIVIFISIKVTKFSIHLTAPDTSISVVVISSSYDDVMTWKHFLLLVVYERNPPVVTGRIPSQLATNGKHFRKYFFLIKFHWKLFPRDQFKIWKHWFRSIATSHNVKQTWLTSAYVSHIYQLESIDVVWVALCNSEYMGSIGSYRTNIKRANYKQSLHSYGLTNPTIH